MNHCIIVTRGINSLRSLLGFGPNEKVVAFIRARLPKVEVQIQFSDGKPSSLSSATINRSPAEEARLLVEQTDALRRSLPVWQGYTGALAKVAQLTLLDPEDPKPEGSALRVQFGCDVFVKAPDGFDFAKQIAKLLEEQKEAQAQIARDQQRLADSRFREKARDEEIQKVVERRIANLAIVATLQSEIVALGSAIKKD